MTDNHEKNRSQYDTTFKDLFTQPPQALLQLVAGSRAVEHLPMEFASTMKRCPDLVFLMEDGSIAHLELQGRPEEMNWRMLMYYPLIRQRHPRRRLTQIVLYVGYEGWNPVGRIEEPTLHFSYRVVDIRTIDCRILMESPLLEENILAILCRMPDREETIREILYRISRLPERARADALTKLVILARLRRVETVILEEAREMSLVFNVMENDVLRPLFLKAQRESELRGEQRGEQRGKLEGKLEGEQRGKLAGRAEMLLQLLEERFGPLSESLQESVRSATLDELTTWSSRLFKAESLQAIFQ